MKDSRKLVLLLLLIGFAALILAGPMGDWLQALIKTHETEVPTTPLAKSLQALPTLHLKHESVKSLGDTQEEEVPEPKPTTLSGRKGTLTNDEIEAALENRQSSFQRCWIQRLKDSPGLTGKLMLQFEISGRGKVQNVLVAESSIHDDLLIRCVESVLERLSFREFGGSPVTLTFPLSFE